MTRSYSTKIGLTMIKTRARQVSSPEIQLGSNLKHDPGLLLTFREGLDLCYQINFNFLYSDLPVRDRCSSMVDPPWNRPCGNGWVYSQNTLNTSGLYPIGADNSPRNLVVADDYFSNSMIL